MQIHNGISLSYQNNALPLILMNMMINEMRESETLDNYIILIYSI